MAEPVKIKFDYKEPLNVEAEVPGAQKIREGHSDDSSSINGDNPSLGESSSKIGENSSSNGENTSKNLNDPETSEGNITSSSYTEVHSIEDDGELITRHRQVFSGKRNGIHGEPVMMADKQVEDKRTRTKIPVSRFRQTVERVKAERRGFKEKKERESNIPVRRSSIPKPVKDHKEHKNLSTVKNEMTITKTEIRKDSEEPTVSKIEVRKKTGSKIEIKKETIDPAVTTTEKRKELKEPTDARIEIRKTSGPTVTTTEIKTVETTEPEDEFDKIYAEIVVDTPTEVVFDDNILNLKVEDPERLESKFEEIIHDYDEHRVEPIDLEVVRRSKIPFLKRRSQQEMELNAQAERTSKIIAARDKLRLRYSLNKGEDFEDELDKELHNATTNIDAKDNKSSEKLAPKTDTKIEKEIKHEVITSPNSKTEVITQFTKTVSTTSSNENENTASSSVVETSTIKEVTTDESTDKKEKKQYFITEENIEKGSIKIGIPIFNSYVHEFSEKNENAKTVEVRRVLSYTSKSDDLSITNQISEKKNEIRQTKVNTADNNFQNKVFKSKDINTDATKFENPNQFDKFINTLEVNNDKSDYPKITNLQEPVKSNETNVGNEVKLRDKVERIISKIDSKELIETESNKRESINELTKKKSVLSKIAMFERKDIDEPILAKVPRKEIKLPKLLTKDWQKVEHVHVHTPLIVDEVFKPFQADIDLRNDDNATESLMKSDDDLTTIVRDEHVMVESPDTVYNTVENKVQTESKTVENKVTEEVIPAEANIDYELTVQKSEIATITNGQPSKGSSITNSLPSPNKDFDKHELHNIKTKRESTTKLSFTKELQAPVIIPGFKPVNELLRSFESKKEVQRSLPKRAISKVEYTITEIETPTVKRSTSTITEIGIPKYSSTTIQSSVKMPELLKANESINAPEILEVKNESYDDFESVNNHKSLDDVFLRDSDFHKHKLRQEDDLRRAKSLAELDLGDAVKGKVTNMILRMKSVDRSELDKKEIINKKEMPRKRSVSEKIALFEGKLTPSRSEPPLSIRIYTSTNKTEPIKTTQKIENTTELNDNYTKGRVQSENGTERTENCVVETTDKSAATKTRDKNNDEIILKNIEELRSARLKYGTVQNMTRIELGNGMMMPVLAVGTAMLDPLLTTHIITAAIDLGYRAIDTAYIYGNEKAVGDGIRAKISDGTVKREDLFIISKLWSTFHRSDLVEAACRASLDALGLDYVDLFLIHNPMSFKEGGCPIPKIAAVVQYSQHDYLDAWYGMELLLSKGLVRAIGVSNFNSVQLQRVLDKGRVKPVVNQVECHPYLSQQRLDLFCSERNVTLSCYGTLGSKGTPLELKSGPTAAIDDAMVQVMASGLGISPAQLLISYQLQTGHGVVVKSSSAAHLWDNLRALDVRLTTVQVDAMHALNRNKRTFTFRGMGDTHRNYPFNIAF